ncbi:MAG: hypothetical protein KJO11_05840 [Gemmatimonadetes bacterium]|nr:hypothetical protein [Gemmatimonadota bacterium]MBT8405809.1 hypothetical protein [Gemmatimonadota bacterium]NNK63565.1 hypothetical protein [Gemmatimonadota bacterium]
MIEHSRRPKTFRIRRLLPLGLLFLSTASAAAAQAPPSSGPAASIEAHLGLTRVAGLSSGWAGASATLHLDAGLRLGGGFWGALRKVDEGPVMEGSGLELGMGYGGLFLERPLGFLPVVPRLLIGGGAVTLRSRLTGSRFDTETFVVVEPALHTEVDLPGPFSAGAGVGYRWIGGADDLFLAGSDDLEGVRGSIFLRLGGH